MSAIVVFMQIFGNVADMAAASPMFWSFSRDKAVCPRVDIFVQGERESFSFSFSILQFVPIVEKARSSNKLTNTLYCLVHYHIGSSLPNQHWKPHRFQRCSFTGHVHLLHSYRMETPLLLYRHLAGAIQVPRENDSPYEPDNNFGRRLVWGPWQIPGIFGIVVSSVDVIYLTVALFWPFWPSEYSVSSKNTNYNFLIIGAVTTFAIVYYVVHSKTRIYGPVVEITSP